MSKSVKYLITIVLLLGANLWLFFSGGSDDSLKTTKYFSSEDLENVSRFLFVMDEDTTKIERTGEGWILNGEYQADEGFVNTLISVLERVEVGRTIEDWDREIMGRAEVEFDFNSRYRFQFATNPTKTKTYFISEGVAKEVAVPGYRDNVADIFVLHPDQWRDRLIIDGSWRTIQKLTVDKQNNDFEITFDDTFFLIDGRTPADSSALVGYLNQFQQFQANEMVSEGRFPHLDSLFGTEPMATISIQDIKREAPYVLQIYPNLDNQGYHLAVDGEGQRMVLDAGRVQRILSHPDPRN
ncbi:hypothetical protein [Ekhidna sp.]|jgi:hypothetical protein|uniref:hypothetical protein n=1 Tax=Ekhidna sp. TaxID=2608089 RepID=UPI0032EDB96A